MSAFDYYTIKQALLPHLQVALNLYLRNQELPHVQPNLHISWNQKNDQITYVWAIALHLSTVQKNPAIQIAKSIAHLIDTTAFFRIFPQTQFSLKNPIDLTLINTQVVPPGLIYLELTDITIGNWLQYLIINHPTIEKSCLHHNSSGSFPFTLQYTYARCCSLLHLANQEKLITLKPQLKDTKKSLLTDWDISPISFFDSQQLLCCHPTERALVKQLFALLDELYCPSNNLKIQWEKIALKLCQAWQDFYTHCRIWGEVERDNLSLATARVGLTFLTQCFLAVLLNDKLEIYAPTKL